MGAGSDLATGIDELLRSGWPKLGVQSPMTGPAATVTLIGCVLETAFG